MPRDLSCHFKKTRPLANHVLPAAVLIVLINTCVAYTQIAPIEGLRDNTPKVHALINARIVPAPGQVIAKGAVIVREGVIVAAGAQVTPPADARVWDYTGKTIYPGFIETYSNLGLPAAPPPTRGQAGGGQAERRTEERRGPRHWNPLMRADDSAEEMFQPDAKKAQALRELGFGAALTAPAKGIFRGASALISLGEEAANRGIIKPNVAQHLAFETATFQDGGYPNSVMGSISFIRQTFLDAKWYEAAMTAYRKNPAQTRPEESPALAALFDAANSRQPVIIEVNDDLNFMRALKIAKEFNLNMIVHGSGHEYRQLDRVKAAGVTLILPLDFPEKPAVETPEDALEVTLEELQHWDMALANAHWLQQAGVSFALSTAKLKKESDFPGHVREVIKRGLPESAALAALTTIPAKIVGEENRLGSIVSGKVANLVVTDGDLFAEKTSILDVWIDGSRHEIKKPAAVDLRGTWEITLTNAAGTIQSYKLNLKGSPEKLSGDIAKEATKANLTKAQLDDKKVALVFKGDSLGHAGVIRLSGFADTEALQGKGELADGSAVSWHARKVAPFEEKSAEKVKAAAAPVALKKVYPFGGYGRSSAPEQPQTVLVRGATIWTSGPQGKLEDADMLIKSGKIAQIGKNLTAPAGAMIIDAKGKHVTPGLIDAHSHSAASSINESGQAVTSEVGIEDVINPTSINIYQQLAGGLTVAHVMHGSANPIGGKNQTMKWRWGADAEGLKFVEAPPTIKFALGENVKRSNSSQPSSRYPATRMGVEQIISDRFKAARDYEKEWNTFNAAGKKNAVATIPPRRDLELETLVEILNGKRFIHCHSYRQDEILMLIRLADEFGFKVGTFQHVLEGYKVADAISTHGAAASCFSDWWAYKFEVYDAIPHNGAMMHKQNIVVSFNSDSGELARRMNLEAAKAVKYGNVPEEEALKFVTLNPAIQLKVDHLVGSLEAGKHADFAIWNGSPLSTYSMCEQTWIEGRKYFDREEDLRIRAEVEKERAALIQKVLSDKEEGAKDSPREAKKPTD
ncbi:amidohydrolase family protein [bacterium]|nr:amidohydrolase family protein [bacterium]